MDKMKVNATSKFAVLDLATSRVDHKAAINKTAAKREQQRTNKESGDRHDSDAGLIGGHFTVTPNPSFVDSRSAYFDKLWAERQAAIAALPDQPITITLPNGEIKQGIAFKTSPLDIALGISKGLADNVIIAKVLYSNRLEQDSIVACDEDEEAEALNQEASTSQGELWDLNRPLVGNCTVTLLKFEEAESKTVRIFFNQDALLSK